MTNNNKKIYRLHQSGPSNQTDWFNSDPKISARDIESIVIQDNTNGEKIPTSIPSPFARIDLVKTAFAAIGNKLDGNTDNHKLVSDALDIGQILFHYDRFEEDLEILVWDRRKDLEELINSDHEGNKQIGDTFSLFLEQDKAFNFDKLDRLYIILYKGKVIGGTSPATLFFAAPDADRYNVTIRFENDTMLDKEYEPLYNREESYIKYLFALSFQQGFANHFPEIAEYLNYTEEKIDKINHNLYSSIQDLKRQGAEALTRNFTEDLTVNGNQGNRVNIIGYNLKKASQSTLEESDFHIQARKTINGPTPLVLPVKTFTEPLNYAGAPWDSNIEVPLSNNLPLNERRLPNVDILHPYLTRADFLNGSIIKLPFEIDSQHFQTLDAENYLLPLNDRFFDYFTIEDVPQLLQMRKLAGDSVEVNLSIPIKGGNITYTKLYHEGNPGLHDERDGEIVLAHLSLCFFPFVVSQNVDIDHRIGLIDLKGDDYLQYRIEPVRTSDSQTQLHVLDHEHHSKAKKHDGAAHNTQYTAFSGKYDAIKLFVEDEIYGFISPKIREHSAGGSSFHFAIDFGTTNTHIEYKEENNNSEVFQINKEDSQLIFLRNTEIQGKEKIFFKLSTAEKFLLQEMHPRTINDKKVASFPQRTVLFEDITVNYQQPTKTLIHANIGFDHERNEIKKHLKAVTELKWSNLSVVQNSRRLQHFLEHLLLLIKGKVLLNRGSLDNVSITWFYPSSMATAQVSQIENLWIDYTRNILSEGPSRKIKKLPESIAPFFYYTGQKMVPSMGKPVVSVDIGGGTTDVAIFENGKPNYITSFRFAGQSIFGDGFNSNLENNGFYKKFRDKYAEYFSANGKGEQQEILKSLENKRGIDFINFLFIQSNNGLISQDYSLEFLLRNDQNLKSVFLVFFSSLFFHIAQLMKSASSEGLLIPQDILFSGTAAKSLFILDSSKDFNQASKLIGLIFSEVYNSDSPQKININLEKDPKEVTTRGGLYANKSIEMDDYKEVLYTGGKSDFGFVQYTSRGTTDNRADEDLTYEKAVSPDVIKDVTNNIQAFYNCFDNISKRLNFQDSFGINLDAINIFNQIRDENIEAYIKEGIHNTMTSSEVSPSNYLDEPLFFYPLIPLLNKLASKTADLD